MSNAKADPAKGKADSDPHKAKRGQSAEERKLEQGLEESMDGSDPVSVTQPKPKQHKP